MRLPRHRPLAHDVEGPLGLADPSHGVVDPSAAEALLGQHETLTGRADQMVGGDPTILEEDLGVVSRAGRSATSGWAIVGMSRRMSHPGRPGRNDEDRSVLVGAVLRVGLGEHENDVGDRRVGDEPFPSVDHPLTAVEHRRGGDLGGIGPGQKRLGQGEGARDLAAHVRPQPALLLLLGGAVGEQLHVAAVGCLGPEDDHRDHRSTDQLRHQGQLHLAESGTAELRIEERPPQAPLLDLGLQVALDESPLRRPAARPAPARAE